MPDATRSSYPPTWSETFAALPLEAPDDSRWPCIAARLEADTARDDAEPAEVPSSPWRARWALAASLFALAALPFVWYAFDRGSESREPSIASVAPVRAPDRAQRPAEQPAPAPAQRATPAVAAVVVSEPAAMRVRDSRRMTTAHEVSAIDARREVAPRIANTPGFERHDPAPRPPEHETPTQPDLEQLYDLSAQLETLLALSRDPRVESGPAAALSSDFDAALALIDDRLALPELPAAERVSLWQARVDTLQQAAGFEGQLRLLAAQGRRFDGTLVGVD